MSILFTTGVDYVEGHFLATAGPQMNYDFSKAGIRLFGNTVESRIGTHSAVENFRRDDDSFGLL